MFIAFEGLDGSGKTTQSKILGSVLANDEDVIITREPGGTVAAERIRELLLDPSIDENFPVKAEALLYYASRLFHTDNVIKPALKEHKIVISDRYHYSTMAYQVARGACSLESIMELDEWCLKGFKPDITFYLSIDPKVSYQRTLERGKLDRLENEYKTFATKAHKIFIDLCFKNPNAHIIDASQSIEKIHLEILTRLKIHRLTKER